MPNTDDRRLASMIEAGLTGNLESVRQLEGAYDHAAVVAFSCAAHALLDSGAVTLSPEQLAALAKAVAVYEDTLGGIGLGSVSIAARIALTLLDNEPRARDDAFRWIANHTCALRGHVGDARTWADYQRDRAAFAAMRRRNRRCVTAVQGAAAERLGALPARPDDPEAGPCRR